MSKEYEFVKNFSKITVKSACDQAGVSKSNYWGERVSKKKAKEVKNIIIASLIKLIQEELQDGN